MAYRVLEEGAEVGGVRNRNYGTPVVRERVRVKGSLLVDNLSVGAGDRRNGRAVAAVGVAQVARRDKQLGRRLRTIVRGVGRKREGRRG